MRTIDERTANETSVLQQVLETAGTGIRVAIPGIVQEYDKDQQTVTVQPAIREKLSFGGYIQEVNIPLLVDVPVVMPRAGGYSLVFAPKAGDECLVVFGDMCIDSWWQSGGVQSQADSRRHDLSDGFAILGCWSQQKKPPIPEEGCRLQEDEEKASIYLKEDEITIKAEKKCQVQNKAGTAGITIDEDGSVNIFGTVKINGNPYMAHTHSVSEFMSNTGGVNNASAV